MENNFNFEKTVNRVSTVSIMGNLFLTLFKFVAGILASSGAMVSDAIHSASDVFSSIIVVIGVKIASKGSDKDHPYGHERFECVAAIILAGVLFSTGLGIGRGAVEDIISGNYKNLAIPGILALVAAIVSIISKELMFQYTKVHAKRINSSALMADAWHHRSDALSSIGALIGIIGARLGYPIFDSIASLVICLFIVKAAYDIFKDSVDKMVDSACEKDMEDEIMEVAKKEEGVLGIDKLTTRVFGSKIYVDIEISADGGKTLTETHAIAENVHDVIENTFPSVKHIMVHVNPCSAFAIR
ncbi:cation diffusion facilitator family transporter [Acetitomaculum ruminis DSM 5522]|uniref:Cation diffusion facilitator family transporter n=1 Tax=Acetitomaculum ruminis DSM 5522 TaxID=1120918 RepID=A0A1I0ZVW2_9FIRM|nr:cation diffusion facilitator family transporter [Acetitomaculum ruminis]SFB29885.1 cation diffusion facilitator family transporter [Acetitomaculum ruminis DSM 5522]